jgi:hypothetical protein
MYRVSAGDHGPRRSWRSPPATQSQPHGDSFKIILKKVLLINNDGYIDNLTFFV